MTLAPGGISINPINWKRDDTPASVKENLGSLTYDGKLVTPGIADARVDTVRGSVVVSSIAQKELYAIPADGAAMFGPESYHLHDYGFFFNNFKQNVADPLKRSWRRNSARIWWLRRFFVPLQHNLNNYHYGKD